MTAKPEVTVETGQALKFRLLSVRIASGASVSNRKMGVIAMSQQRCSKAGLLLPHRCFRFNSSTFRTISSLSSVTHRASLLESVSLTIRLHNSSMWSRSSGVMDGYRLNQLREVSYFRIGKGNAKWGILLKIEGLVGKNRTRGSLVFHRKAGSSLAGSGRQALEKWSRTVQKFAR